MLICVRSNISLETLKNSNPKADAYVYWQHVSMLFCPSLRSLLALLTVTHHDRLVTGPYATITGP